MTAEVTADGQLFINTSGYCLKLSPHRAEMRIVERSQTIAPDTPIEVLYPLVDRMEEGYVRQSLEEYLQYLEEFQPGVAMKLRRTLAWPVCVTWFKKLRLSLSRSRLREELIYAGRPYGYFNLYRKLIENSPACASAQEWRNRLEKLTTQGVSQSEINWSGLWDYVSAVKPGRKVHRNELLRQVRLHGLTPIMFIVKHSLENFSTAATRVAWRKSKDLYKPTVQGTLYYVSNTQPRFHIYHHLSRKQTEAREWWTLTDQSQQPLLDENGDRKQFTSASSAMDYVKRHWTGLTKTAPSFWQRSFMKYSLPGGVNYTEWLITLPALKQSFYSDHYNYRNVLMHFRTSERKVNGIGRILLIDEFQSDWNQKGRRFGFYRDENNREENQVPENPYQNNWAELGLRLMLVKAAEQGFDGVAWSNSEIQAQRYRIYDRKIFALFYDTIISRVVAKIAKKWRLNLCQIPIPTSTRNYFVSKDVNDHYIVSSSETHHKIFNAFEDESMAWHFQQACEEPVDEMLQGLLFSEQMKKELVEEGLPYSGAIARSGQAGIEHKGKHKGARGIKQ